MEIDPLKHLAQQVRRDIVRMVHTSQSGHPGGSLGCADYLVALYFYHMEYDSASFDINGIGEDLFFLSNGHISPLFYSILARAGYFPLEELATFRKISSRLQGHPTTHDGLPGIRIASGSLGQGLSVAIGAALAKKLNGDDRFVFCLHGDGELQEGQIWEAAMFAAHNKVDKLIAAVDVNGQQIDGTTEQVLSLGNLRAKWEAFGWQVWEVDGHDMEQLIETIGKVKAASGKGRPQMLLLQTEMGHGVDFMAGSHKWHGIAPNDEQLEAALLQLHSNLEDYD